MYPSVHVSINDLNDSFADRSATLLCSGRSITDEGGGNGLANGQSKVGCGQTLASSGGQLSPKDIARDSSSDSRRGIGAGGSTEGCAGSGHAVKHCCGWLKKASGIVGIQADNQRIAQLKRGDWKKRFWSGDGMIIRSRELQLLSSDARVRRGRIDTRSEDRLLPVMKA